MSETSIAATGSRAKVTIGDESQFGTPVQPNFAVSFTSESISNEEDTLESSQIRADRGMHVMEKGNESVSGDLSFEMTAGGLGKIFKHALGEFVRLPNTDGGLHGRMETASVETIDRGSAGDNRVILPFTKDSVVDGYKKEDGQFLVVSENASGGRTNDQLDPEGVYSYDRAGGSEMTHVNEIIYDSYDPKDDTKHAVRVNISDVLDADGNRVEPSINRQAGLMEVGHDRSQFPYYTIRRVDGRAADVKYATDSPVDIGTTNDYSSGGSNTIDGQSLSDGDRVLLKDQNTDSENGIYDVVDAADTTTWQRVDDYDDVSEVDQGSFVEVTSGNNRAGNTYVQIESVSTLGSDPINFERDGLFIDDQDVLKGIDDSGATVTVKNTSLPIIIDASSLDNGSLSKVCEGDILRLNNGGQTLSNFTVSTNDNDEGNIFVVTNVDYLNENIEVEHKTGGLGGSSGDLADGDSIHFEVLKDVSDVDELAFIHGALSIPEDELSNRWNGTGSISSSDLAAGFDETKGNWVYQYDDQWNDVYTYHFKRARYVPEGLTVEVHRDAAAFVYSGCKVSSLSLTMDTNSYVTGTATLTGKSEHSMGELALDVAPNDGWVYVKDADAIVDPSNTDPNLTTFIGIGERINIEYTEKRLVSGMSNSTDDGVKKVKDDPSLDETDIYALKIPVSGGESDIDVFHPKGKNVDPLTTTAITDSNGNPEIENDENVPLTSFESMIYFQGYFEEALSADVTLENNPSEDKFGLGSREVLDIPMEQAAVSGTVSVEFDDGKHLRKFKDGDKFAIELRAVEEGDEAMIRNDTCGPTGVLPQAYVFMPRCKLNGNTPTVDDESYIEHDLPFSAIVDDEYNTTDLTMIIVNSYADDVEKDFTSPNDVDTFSP